MLAPVVPDKIYILIQAASMARDIRSGALSEPEIDIALAALRPGDVAIDLGANYGMYAIPMARRVAPHGRVYAFEPVPSTVSALHTVARLFRVRNIDIRPKACGEDRGDIALSVPLQASGAISAGQAHSAQRNDDRPGREHHVRAISSHHVTCELVALDEELDDVRGIALIKADIEGMELFAFRGARRLLERDLPIVISEINPWFLEGFAISLGDFLGLFESLGYGIYRVDDVSGRLRVVAVTEDLVEDNYVFVHPARADRIANLLS